MNLHEQGLQQDVINTLGTAINPLDEEEVVHEVTNKGFKKQRIYVDSEILEVLESLVDMGFVSKDGNKYEWIK